jgi:chromosome segregation ATPase
MLPFSACKFSGDAAACRELRAMEEDLKNEASWVPKTNLFQAKVAEIEQLRGECRDALLVQAQLRSDKEAAAREIAQLQGEYENLRLMLSHHEVRPLCVLNRRQYQRMISQNACVRSLSGVHDSLGIVLRKVCMTY